MKKILVNAFLLIGNHLKCLYICGPLKFSQEEVSGKKKLRKKSLVYISVLQPQNINFSMPYSLHLLHTKEVELDKGIGE